jgi:hypothetical protein
MKIKKPEAERELFNLWKDGTTKVFALKKLEEENGGQGSQYDLDKRRGGFFHPDRKKIGRTGIPSSRDNASGQAVLGHDVFR